MEYQKIKILLERSQRYTVEEKDVIRESSRRRVGNITEVTGLKAGVEYPKNQVDIMYADFSLQEQYLDQSELLEYCEHHNIPFREVLDLSETQLIHGDNRKNITDALVYQATRALKLAERVKDMKGV